MYKFFDKFPGLGILLFFCGALALYTVVISLWAIPGLILVYLLYMSSIFIFNAAPFKTNSDSFLEFILGYNSFILSLMGIFLLMLFGISVYHHFFKKDKISIEFSDLLKGAKKFIYFWFGANVFILIPIVGFYIIAGALSGSSESCNLLVCY